MKQNNPENEVLVRAIKFLRRTKEGEYCKLDIDSFNNRRINTPVVSTEEELYYYSISN